MPAAANFVICWFHIGKFQLSFLHVGAYQTRRDHDQVTAWIAWGVPEQFAGVRHFFDYRNSHLHSASWDVLNNQRLTGLKQASPASAFCEGLVHSHLVIQSPQIAFTEWTNRQRQRHAGRLPRFVAAGNRDFYHVSWRGRDSRA